MFDPSLEKGARKIFNRNRIVDTLKNDPWRFSDELTQDELDLLDSIELSKKEGKYYLGNTERYKAEELSKEQLDKAKKIFNNSRNAASYYANYLNRNLISRFFFLNSKPFRAFIQGTYDLAKTLNPVHEAGDIGYRVVFGKHMISGEPEGRKEAVTELILVLTAFKLSKIANSRATMKTSATTNTTNSSKPISYWEIPKARTGGLYDNKTIKMTNLGKKVDKNYPVIIFKGKTLEKFRVVADKDGRMIYAHSGQLVNTHGQGIYVMDRHGNIFFHEKPSYGSVHHSSIAGGDDPVAAGEGIVRNGKPISLNENTGHYGGQGHQPPGRIELFEKELKVQGINVEDTAFKKFE